MLWSWTWCRELFALVFWGRGLLCWFSGWLVWVEILIWGAGGRAWCKWILPPLGGTVLLPEGAFHWWVGWTSLCPPSSPEMKVCTPHSSGNPQRRAINRPSCVPRFPSKPQVHPACVQAFLSQVQHWVSKLHILGIPVAWTSTAPLGEGLAMLLLPGLGKQLHNCTAVQSLCQNRAESWYPRLTPMPGNRAAHWCHLFFLWARRPSDHVVIPGIPPWHLSTFRPGSYLTVADFKKFCCLYYLAVASECSPSPSAVSAAMSLPSQLSPPPTFQKVVAFLLVVLQFLFSQTSHWFLGCPGWFDNYVAVFEGPDKLGSPYSSSILTLPPSQSFPFSPSAPGNNW